MLFLPKDSKHLQAIIDSLHSHTLEVVSYCSHSCPGADILVLLLLTYSYKSDVAGDSNDWLGCIELGGS